VRLSSGVGAPSIGCDYALSQCWSAGRDGCDETITDLTETATKTPGATRDYQRARFGLKSIASAAS
jgi:hypothetical protein